MMGLDWWVEEFFPDASDEMRGRLTEWMLEAVMLFGVEDALKAVEAVLVDA